MAKLFTILTNKEFQNLTISHFNTTLGMNLLIPVLPVFLQQQSFAETQIGIIMGVTAASALFIRPWVGLRIDIEGSRPYILIGQLLLILSIIGYLWAATFLAFFLLRLLFGIALAFYNTSAITFASGIGTGETNASAIALFTLTTMLGLGFSMSISQIAFDSFGFPLLVWISLLLTAVAFGVMKLRSDPLPLASGHKTRASFVAVLSSKVVLATAVCQFATSFAFSALLTFVPLAALAKNIQFYSLFFISFAIFVIISRLFVQQIVNKLGLEKTTLSASLTMLVSILLLLANISPAILILSGILLGIGFGTVFPTLVLLLVHNVKESNRGTSLSILTAFGDTGTALSAAILGGVAEHLGYSALFIITAATFAICIYYFYQIIIQKEETSNC